MPGHIVAMGGGGFSMEAENPLLDEFVLSLSAKRPKVCFIATASGDSADYTARFYDAFYQQDCEPTHLHLFRPPEGSLRDFVMAQDIFYVGGGNTRNLVVLWREWGLDQLLREAWESGKVLAGISAGCICWFEQGITDSVTLSLTVMDCLGFLPGSACPHYDGEPARQPAYTGFAARGEVKPGLALDDSVAAHFVGTELKEIVSSRKQGRAFRVSASGEESLRVRYLGLNGTNR